MNGGPGRIDIVGAYISVDRTGLLVGSWFSGITYGVEAIQLYTYLSTFPKDHLFLKLSVLFLFAAETAATVLLFIATHYHLVSVQPGSLDAFTRSLSMVCLPFVLATIVAGVNTFLIWRYHKLTKRLWLCIFLYAVLAASYSCHMWATALNLKLRTFSLADVANLPGISTQAGDAGTAGLSMEVSLVCLIWLLLLAHLLSLLRRDMQDAKRIIVRLLLVTLESGTAASGFAITSLVVYVKTPASSNLLVIAVFMARVYFMNLLFNLNLRTSGHIMRESSSNNRNRRLSITGTGTSTCTGSTNVPLSDIRSYQGNNRFQHNIVHISQSTDTKEDKENKFSKLAIGLDARV